MTPRKLILFLSILSLTCFSPTALYGAEAENGQAVKVQEYQKRLDNVKTKSDITEQGFRIIKNQVFPVSVNDVGEVTLIPAMEDQYHRLVLFFADDTGSILMKTDQLETNIQHRGQLEQPVERVAAISFQDMNADDLTDIILITSCTDQKEGETGRPYKVGDVLFQKDGTFYRDYRLSDKLNRFGMNKSIKFITSFIRDGYSTEFLYTATTQKELLHHGFQAIPGQYRFVPFEKLGKLLVMPGTYRMAEYTVFMVYLINDRGTIVWSFQPMGDYESLYAFQGISLSDIDGDGLKDVLIRADYSYEGSDGQPVVDRDYAVYYQRTNGFYQDTDIKNQLVSQEKETMTDLLDRMRAYWGWKSE